MGKMAHAMSTTDESIEPVGGGAMGTVNIPGPIQVGDIMDLMGTMDRESSRPDSSGIDITTPLPSFDTIEGVDRTPGTSKRDTASPDNCQEIDGTRRAIELEAVDLMTFTDDYSYEGPDTQRSISGQGRSAMPVSGYYGRNLDVEVCSPNKKKQVLYSKERKGLLANPATDGPDASSTILDEQVPGEPLPHMAGPEYRSTEESAIHSSQATSATCNLCLAMFPTKSKMFRHIRKDHGGFKNDARNGRKAPSSFTTHSTAKCRRKGEGKPESRTAVEPSTGIEEQDMMCKETGKKFQDALKAIRVYASGQRLAAQGPVDNQRFVTPFEQLNLQSSVDKAEELVNIGKRLSGWVEEMVRNGMQRRARQKDQESMEREEEAGNELAEGQKKEQDAQQLGLELDLDLDLNLDLDLVTDPKNGVCEDLIDLNCD